MKQESKTNDVNREYRADELAEDGLERVSGGEDFNPQPEPPGRPWWYRPFRLDPVLARGVSLAGGR